MNNGKSIGIGHWKRYRPSEQAADYQEILSVAMDSRSGLKDLTTSSGDTPTFTTETRILGRACEHRIHPLSIVP